MSRKGLAAYKADGFTPARYSGHKSTHRFVRLIAGSLGREVCFRMFRDHGVGGGRAMKGTLHACLPELSHSNDADGLGAFMVINEGGPEEDDGHTDSTIARVRACFVDADISKGEGTPLDRVKWHLLPSLIVERGTNWHAYWFVDDMPLEDFEPAQRRLAAFYGTDPSICNLSRVMRLPGFLHQKNPKRPQPVTLIDPLPAAQGNRSLYAIAGLVYTPGEVIEGTPLISSKHKPHASKLAPENRRLLVEPDLPDSIEAFITYLDRQHHEWQRLDGEYGFHVRNKTSHKIGVWGFAFGLSEEAAVNVGRDWFFERCDNLIDFDTDEFERASLNGHRQSIFDFGERSPDGLRRIRAEANAAMAEIFAGED